MGAFLDKPKTEKYNESNVGGGLKYGLSSMQGWRIEMEDAHSAVIGIPDQKENVSWFAVFDGHAGSRVSAHCSHHLLDCIRYLVLLNLNLNLRIDLELLQGLRQLHLQSAAGTNSVPGRVDGGDQARYSQGLPRAGREATEDPGGGQWRGQVWDDCCVRADNTEIPDHSKLRRQSRCLLHRRQGSLGHTGNI